MRPKGQFSTALCDLISHCGKCMAVFIRRNDENACFAPRSPFIKRESFVAFRLRLCSKKEQQRLRNGKLAYVH